MQNSPTVHDGPKPLVSPQNSGDVDEIASGESNLHVVSPLSVDQQLQREVNLSYPEVHLGPSADRSPEVVTFRDGSDAPEVVPANNPGYDADEKYMPPRWYRDDPDKVFVKQDEKATDIGGTTGLGKTESSQLQSKSGFDAELETREGEEAGAEKSNIKSRRRMWIWIGTAAVVLGIIALAIGLGVSLGMKDADGDERPTTSTSSSSDNSSPNPPTSSSSTSSTSTTSSATPTSTTLRCPGSNSTTYTTGGKAFVVECGIDHSGGNIDIIDADNLTFCIDSCAASDRCVGATFLGAACYLKSTWSDPVFSNSEVAGARLVS